MWYPGRVVETALVLAVAACTACVALAGSVVRTRRLPESVLGRLVALEEAKLADRETIETLIERAEDAFDRAERKRNSAAAAASRANKALAQLGEEEGNHAPLTRAEQLRQIGRQLGVEPGVI